MTATFNIVPYTIASFGTLLLYDYLCTFADEVSLVWQQPFHVGTILFFLNRYPPFIDTFMSLFLLTTVQSPETCTRVFKTVTWLIVLGVFIAEIILMLRTYAIYERKRWVLILLSCVFVIDIVPGIIVVQMELNSLRYGIPKGVPYTGCALVEPASVIIFVAYVLVVFSETIIVCLTLYKAVQHLRRSNAPLVVNLYRNGLMFYAYILAISLANVIVPVTARDVAYDNWLATPQRVLHSIFCNRILLSILSSRRELLAHSSASPSAVTNSRFSFARPPASKPLIHPPGTSHPRSRGLFGRSSDPRAQMTSSAWARRYNFNFTSVLGSSSGSDSQATSDSTAPSAYAYNRTRTDTGTGAGTETRTGTGTGIGIGLGTIAGTERSMSPLSFAKDAAALYSGTVSVTSAAASGSGSGSGSTNGPSPHPARRRRRHRAQPSSIGGLRIYSSDYDDDNDYDEYDEYDYSAQGLEYDYSRRREEEGGIPLQDLSPTRVGQAGMDAPERAVVRESGRSAAQTQTQTQTGLGVETTDRSRVDYG